MKTAGGKGSAKNAKVVVTEKSARAKAHEAAGIPMPEENDEESRYAELVAGQKAAAIEAARKARDKAKQQLEWAEDALRVAIEENS